MLFSTTCPDRDRAKEIKAEFLAALGLKDDWGPPLWPLPNAQEITESSFWDWRTSQNFPAEIWTGQQRYGGSMGPPAALLARPRPSARGRLRRTGAP